eukprot:TRINITY_DN1606_c0_g4_i1.p1 TRINITY_DN1606_c0_g4~~TRINITY_DN1606_c0_g4_i1.p1  ORF type:complete len:279 (-),score=25.36 TRINITY_DN1606_c0_g4_i1:235-1071(-)
MAAALDLRGILAQLRRAGGKASAGEGLNANFSVSVTAASNAHDTGVSGLNLSAQQLTAIQAAWAAVCQADFPGEQRSVSTDVGVKMFLTLFEQDPVLLDMFPFKDDNGKPIEKELRVHAAKVVTALGSVIEALTDPAAVKDLDQLVRNHMKYGVKEQHYTAVFAALVATLEQELAIAWTDDVVMAWNTLFESVQGLVTAVYRDYQGETSQLARLNEYAFLCPKGKRHLLLVLHALSVLPGFLSIVKPFFSATVVVSMRSIAHSSVSGSSLMVWITLLR